MLPRFDHEVAELLVLPSMDELFHDAHGNKSFALSIYSVLE